MDAPPRYTRVSIPDPWGEAESLMKITRAFLLDTLAFLYKIDHNALRTALPPSFLPCYQRIHDDANAPKTTRPSLICNMDQAEMDRLAATVLKASESVAKNRISLITNTEYMLMYYRMLRPAHELNVPYEYVFHLLSLHAVHKGVEWHKAGLHSGQS